MLCFIETVKLSINVNNNCFAHVTCINTHIECTARTELRGIVYIECVHLHVKIVYNLCMT